MNDMITPVKAKSTLIKYIQLNPKAVQHKGVELFTQIQTVKELQNFSLFSTYSPQLSRGIYTFVPHAAIAQLVERQLPKLKVAGSSPVCRSISFSVYYLN